MIQEKKASQPFLCVPPCPQELHVWQVWYWVQTGVRHWKMDFETYKLENAREQANAIVQALQTWVRIVEIDFTAKPDGERLSQ